ncbi:hypothetical protein CI238_03344 [Colletotrichum incanum]|uniref:Uncharacterized protein n=1 Tax=Colletotrichum incanum TaxID=1573173 RepID=A0A167B9M9_COLIC|nr:hypothetical protein CI238_03344 [Colletotrichum incanum]
MTALITGPSEPLRQPTAPLSHHGQELHSSTSRRCTLRAKSTVFSVKQAVHDAAQRFAQRLLCCPTPVQLNMYQLPTATSR